MIELIPAIDIINGKCVRLTQGNYDKKKQYSDNPVEVAKSFEDVGVRRLHLVDLDGAKSSCIVNIKVLEGIANNTNLTIDFGGGIKTEADLTKAFNYGASMVTIGSLAVKSPETIYKWIDLYGNERIIIGADLKNGFISINGWQEEGDDELFPFIEKYTNKGISKLLCTDISKDGMLAGPAIELYKKILDIFPTLHLIASGGVSDMNDIHDLENAGIPAVVFGKAFYEGKISLKDIQDYLS